MPSEEVSTAPGIPVLPLKPTATQGLPAVVTENNTLGVPEFCSVQTSPLGEVAITPPTPTATSWPPVQVTEYRALSMTEFTGYQSTPSEEIRMTQALA